MFALEVSIGVAVLLFEIVITGFAGLMQKLRLTDWAASYVELPACEAVIVSRPGSTILNVFPTRAAGVSLLTNNTVSPELAVALSVIVGSPMVTFGID